MCILKKSLPIMLLIVVILSSVLTVKANVGVVDADILNFRQGPSVMTKRIGRIPGGTKVKILDKSNKDWYIIEYDNKKGYVSSDYIIEVEGDSNFGSGVVNATALHVRKSPSLQAKILTKVYNGERVNVLDKVGDWYKISHNGGEAYVYSIYINLDSSKSSNIGKVYEVTCNILNMRKGPSTSTDKIGSLRRGEKVTLVKTEGEWFYIKDSKGKHAYVHSDYVKIANSTTTSRGSSSNNTSTSSKSSSSNVADDLINYAKKFLGVNYVYGGANPSGFDCSGFTSYVFKQFGYKINRVSRDQAKNGVAVSKSNLKKGDLVFFSSSRSSNTIGHVGIYIGGGKFIHSSSGKQRGVIISSLSEPFYVDTYKTARRIIK